MHYKDFTNKCNRSLHSEYNTMQTNAIVEDRVTDSTLCLLYSSSAMFHTRKEDRFFSHNFNVPSGLGNLTTHTEWIKMCNLALYVIE